MLATIEVQCPPCLFGQLAQPFRQVRCISIVEPHGQVHRGRHVEPAPDLGDAVERSAVVARTLAIDGTAEEASAAFQSQVE